MKYSVEIIDTATGESRTYTNGLEWDDGCEFWWTEGNMGCDCNRGASFARAKDPQADAWSDEWICTSITGIPRYFVPRAILADGTVVPLDLPR